MRAADSKRHHVGKRRGTSHAKGPRVEHQDGNEVAHHVEHAHRHDGHKPKRCRPVNAGEPHHHRGAHDGEATQRKPADKGCGVLVQHARARTKGVRDGVGAHYARHREHDTHHKRSDDRHAKVRAHRIIVAHTARTGNECHAACREHARQTRDQDEQRRRHADGGDRVGPDKVTRKRRIDHHAERRGKRDEDGNGHIGAKHALDEGVVGALNHTRQLLSLMREHHDRQARRRNDAFARYR